MTITDKVCKWCGKQATHVTSKGVYVCAQCNGNPALTKWKRVSKHSRLIVRNYGDVFLGGRNP